MDHHHLSRARGCPSVLSSLRPRASAAPAPSISVGLAPPNRSARHSLSPILAFIHTTTLSCSHARACQGVLLAPEGLNQLFVHLSGCHIQELKIFFIFNEFNQEEAHSIRTRPFGGCVLFSRPPSPSASSSKNTSLPAPCGSPHKA